ncbi:MAG: PA2778 family cysteine peptidase [Gammaproteobacteria bacterium]|nr:PA2778 family cysteine peptidase [Gammaproteobacteria bacterium]NIR81773.1 PA2778 family cysteine peptidase [Gammaproteobacteria bacterium]NIR88576.1 PA2778 family cysteine peptidase [Gammaproteobacteria bacterium]NIU02880.1 PA2778 family cysteine peptidase [Gammaproteobacteria bacterium]NIV50402.1 PA2778 family cysteine peptidase [Gammaproteobacteria bacterium]
MRGSRIGFAATCALLGPLAVGCATTARSPQLPEGVTSVELNETPFFAQERYQCGPAALATVLGASGVEVEPDELVAQVYLPARKGSLQVEMLAATRARGRLAYATSGEFDAVLAELDAGRPVLVLQNLGLEIWPRWHYAVVVGFDAQRDAVILRSGVERRETLSRARFLETWQRAGAWGFVVLRPGELPAAADASRYLEAAAALESAGRTEAARRSYETAVRRWPASPIAWLGLGNTRYAQGDLRAAERAYRELLERAPDDPVARNNLAQVLTERGCHGAALAQVEAGLSLLGPGDALRPALAETRTEIRLRRTARSVRGSESGCAADPPGAGTGGRGLSAM